MAASIDAIESLSNAIRRAANPRTWSRGVMIARDDAVEGRSETDEEIVLAVRTPDRPVPFSVVLYLETEEWDCDCVSSLDVCAHAAAAVIALLRAKKAGEDLPGRNRAGPKLRYRFSREGRDLILERLLVDATGATKRATGPIAQDRSLAGKLSEIDLRLDPLLPKGRAAIASAEQAAALIPILAEGAEVYLDDRSVRVSKERLRPQGKVTGDDRELVLAIDRDPSVTEVLADAIVSAGDTIHLIGELGLSGPRLEKLPTIRTFSRAHFAELAAEVLPMLAGRIELEIATKSLPPLGGPGTPRIDFHVEYGEERVAVTPELVYGNELRIEDRRPIYLGGAVPKRDHRAERDLLERLRDELNLVPGRRVELKGAEASAFLRKLREFMQSTGEQLIVPQLQPRLELDGDRFTFDLESPDGARADPIAALRAFAAGEDLVPLIGGGFGELPRGFLSEHGDRIAMLLHLSGDHGVPTSALPELAKLCEALDRPPPPALDRLAPLVEGFERIPEAALPSDLTAVLRPYQKRGVDWLCFLRDAGLGAVLADDMGLGKTLQALAAVRARALIVCPTSVLPNWAREIARFRPALKVCVFHGSSRALDPDADVTITTYALLRSEAELQKIRWATVVLDEAQAIKNPESQTARAAYGLDAAFRIALTGTPVENRLEELWSLIHFTNPGVLHGRSEFSDRFARPIAEGDPRAAQKLRDRIRPFVLRRLKREVARDLPPRTEMVLYAELRPEERAIYDAVRAATKREIVAKLDGGGGVMAALEALLRLRQACCHSGLVPGHDADSSSKIETLLESLAEAVAEGHKALVFSQWTALLDRLEPHLEHEAIRYLRLDGSTKNRGELVEAFQREEGPPVMIISLKAGGTGLNLTAADHVFLLDPWWNPAVEDQAADRAHRIGQDRPVMVYRLVAKDTVEERILDLQLRKRLLADAALEGAAAPITRDDLLALLD